MHVLLALWPVYCDFLFPFDRVRFEFRCIDPHASSGAYSSLRNEEAIITGLVTIFSGMEIVLRNPSCSLFWIQSKMHRAVTDSSREDADVHRGP